MRSGRQWPETDHTDVGVFPRDKFNDAIRKAMARDTGTRWLYENGMFVFNTSSPALFRTTWMDMTMEGSAEKIRCPTLVTAGASDHFDPGAVPVARTIGGAILFSLLHIAMRHIPAPCMMSVPESHGKPDSGTRSAAFFPADTCLTGSGHVQRPDSPENMQNGFIEHQV